MKNQSSVVFTGIEYVLICCHTNTCDRVHAIADIFLRKILGNQSNPIDYWRQRDQFNEMGESLKAFLSVLSYIIYFKFLTNKIYNMTIGHWTRKRLYVSKPRMGLQRNYKCIYNPQALDVKNIF